MKLLIYKSELTGATYAWNGNESTIIETGDHGDHKLPLGKVSRNLTGKEAPQIEDAHKNGKPSFEVNGVKYTVTLNVGKNPEYDALANSHKELVAALESVVICDHENAEFHNINDAALPQLATALRNAEKITNS